MKVVLEVVAEPTRRRILDLLLESDRAVGEVVAELGMSQPGVSKHLRILREAELVEARAEGRQRVYALRPERLAELDAWLTPYRRLWTGRLDALARTLDERNPT